jgi:hypothetical protein
MQMMITFMAVVGGMILSLAVALLTEELIFGQVFRLFFSRQTGPSRNPSQHEGQALSAKENDHAGIEEFTDGGRSGNDNRGDLYSRL